MPRGGASPARCERQSASTRPKAFSTRRRATTASRRRRRKPAPPAEVNLTRRTNRWLSFEHLEFESGYAPHRDEPGAARWQSYVPCRTAHAWLLRLPRGASRPWLVCIPGYGMGSPWIDCNAFQTLRLAAELRVNVAIPVLPLHGPRRTGWMSGDGCYFSGDCLDTLHAQAQAVWDVRRLIAWLRARRAATDIGVYGLSLGGYTTALLAALDPALRCAVAGIPASDFIQLGQLHLPSSVLGAALRHGFDWQAAARALRVISPLAMPARVARDRRFLFAAIADRIVPLSQARRLWQHWQRPRALWYRGSHLSFGWESSVQQWVFAALAGALERGHSERRAAA